MMRLTRFSFPLLFSALVFCRSAHSADQVCQKWFERNVKKIQSDCELDCASLITDMGTFHCPSECDELCSAFKKNSSSGLGQLLYYPGLTPAERKLVDKTPKEAIVVFVQKTRAELSSSRNFPAQKYNDEGDAFRHFIWAGLLTKELAPARVKSYLDAHEGDPAQPGAERSMDEFHNGMGQKAAEKLSAKGSWTIQELEREGLDALRSKKLSVLNPGLNIPKEHL